MPTKHYLNLAREVTFKTAPSTGWTGVYVEDLGGHNPAVVTQQRKGMAYGQQGMTTKGRSSRIRGGKGQVKAYLEDPSRALLNLLEGTFGDPTVTELAANEAYQWVFSTAAAVPDLSFSTQIGREFSGGTQDRDTFSGGQIEKMAINQGMTPMASGVTDEGLAKVVFDLDYATMAQGTERLPTYTDPDAVFSGGDLTVQIGTSLGSLSSECVDGVTFEFMPGLNFEDAQCATSATRDKAGRGAMPAGTLAFPWTYKNRTYYDAWLAGTVLAARIKYEATGVWLDAGETEHPSVQIDIAAFGLNGDTPKESADAATKQDLTSDILWNEDDPMIEVTVVTSLDEL